MFNKSWKKRISLLMLAVMLAFMPTMYAFAGSLKEAKEEKEQLENSLKEAQKLVDTLKGSKETIEEKVTELDGKLTDISANITDLEAKLEVKNQELFDTQVLLEEAILDEREQYERMKIRIRFMYENGKSSYMERLLNAENFADFLNAIEYIRQISAYDRAMLEQYRQTQTIIADAKTALEEDKLQLEQMQTQVTEEKQAVETLLTAKETELASVDKNLDKASELADVFAAEIEAQNAIIAQIKQAEAAKEAARKKAEEEARKKAEEEAQKKAEENGEAEPDESGSETEIPEDSYNGGAFAWPCPSSKRITSDYGNRISPTEGASSDHKGIDIGAAYGADIVAAADGIVIFSGYSSAAGNYVMIDHGGSLYTVYMHASALCVSQGETVTREQVIAKVGSTGISTGNHLHFGVSLNGSYVSPWNYLSN
ncbi:MAG: peptidoglycan DD-metalloendopeptidase family protein [Lachnospiraceae bacterium]|nr:peptidoglycan DD-metalloendopeptidase family protein [Lachnospiraceae bacterium]